MRRSGRSIRECTTTDRRTSAGAGLWWWPSNARREPDDPRRAATQPPAPACPRGLRSLPLWPELLRPARPPRPGVEDDASARDGRGAGLAGERPGAPPRDRAAAALQRALRDRAA